MTRSNKGSDKERSTTEDSSGSNKGSTTEEWLGVATEEAPKEAVRKRHEAEGRSDKEPKEEKTKDQLKQQWLLQTDNHGRQTANS